MAASNHTPSWHRLSGPVAIWPETEARTKPGRPCRSGQSQHRPGVQSGRSQREPQVQVANQGQDQADNHSFVSFVRHSFDETSGGGFPPPFGATLRVRVRVRALLREVFAGSFRSARIDQPRRILGLDRASEVLAKESAKRLRVATDLVRELLRCERLRVCHVPSLRCVRRHAHTLACPSFVCAFDRTYYKHFTFVRFVVFVNRSFVRSLTYTRATPPAAPPKGPTICGDHCSERSGLAVRFLVPRGATCVG